MGWGARQAPAGGHGEAHTSVGPVVLGSLVGAVVGAEPVTRVRTLRWVTPPFRTGMKAPAQRPGRDNWDIPEPKGKEEAQ